MRSVSKFGVVSALLLMMGTQACRSVQQRNGQCTMCFADQILQGGFCYDQIQGCSNQRRNQCLCCAKGYLLNNNKCCKTDQFHQHNDIRRNNDNRILGQTNQNSNQRIIQSGGFQILDPSLYNSQSFNIIKIVIKKLFPDFSNSAILKVEQQIVAGTNYKVYFTFNNVDIYQIKAFLPLPNSNKDVQIFQIKKNGIMLNLNGQSQTISQPGGNQVLDPSNYKIQSFVLAQRQILKIFPDFDTSKIIRVQSQIVAGTNYFVFFSLNQVDIIEVKIFIPLPNSNQNPSVLYVKLNGNLVETISQQTVIQQTQNQSMPLAGSLQILSPQQYNTERFVEASKQINRVFSNFRFSKIIRVQQQIVAGTNYIVFFTLNDVDIFQVKVFVPLPNSGQKVSIISFKLNGKNVDPSSNNNQILNSNPNNVGSINLIQTKPIQISNIDPPILTQSGESKQVFNQILSTTPLPGNAPSAQQIKLKIAGNFANNMAGNNFMAGMPQTVSFQPGIQSNLNTIQRNLNSQLLIQPRGNNNGILNQFINNSPIGEVPSMDILRRNMGNNFNNLLSNSVPTQNNKVWGSNKISF